MRRTAHFWTINNRATSQLVNTPLFIVHMFLSKHHTKQRKTGKYATRMRYISVCAPVDWRMTTERHTMNVTLTWYKRFYMTIRVILT